MNEALQKSRLRVAVGMSGGLDSSVTAALLQEQGHDVIGLSAHMWKEGSRCCSLEDVARAARVATFLGIPHHVVDTIGLFGEMIVRPFVEEYARGRTPSPCVRCNQVIKFGVLMKEAIQRGCTHVATGHYARIVKAGESWHLLRGRDGKKDQSYFLHRLDQAQLGRILLPLGDWTKPEAADYAQKRGLPVPLNTESQDLCFVPDAGYVPFVEKYRPQLRRRGAIVDAAGRKLGEHEGFHRFTIGQREGIGVAAKERLYVKELRPETNTVVVGARREVMSERCRVEDVHWISGSPPPDGLACRVRLRYRHQGAPAVLRIMDPTTAEAVFESPQFAVTPGQAGVFYVEDEVLGGGWIA